MLSEILHELIDAAAPRIGLDRARELHDLADTLDTPETAEAAEPNGEAAEAQNESAPA